ncbi:hypothetical protein [Allohahella sp. A8]|uniref:hypothetical protein n=1 Tax=Allohahella sp. A8 TaxID=3141461 RepID=UPI003A8026C8
MFDEANWDLAPGLTEGALTLSLSAETCNLNYWINAVAQGTWHGLVNGHKPEAQTPDRMKQPGPLRDAMIEELGYRSIAEELAARALSYLVIHAPDISTMEFYLTQAIDEARHASIFRGHLFEMGIREDELATVLERYVGEQRKQVLEPLEAWVLSVVRDQGDFIGGVVLFTIMVEGVLAPAAEISERKWRLIDPAAAQIEHGANIDEIRHLTVGASIIQQHLQRRPEDKPRILELIKAGVSKWKELPTAHVTLRREALFQQGMADLRDLLQGYELIPGTLLIETDPQARMDIANKMTRELQEGRLRFMGLEEAIEFLA